LNRASSYSHLIMAASSPSPSKCIGVNAAQLIGVDSTIYQVVGVPTPQGYIAVMPKYAPCRGRSLWSSASGPLCRIVKAYGPLGVDAGLAAWGRGLRWDPIYRAPMPYISEEEAVVCVEPRRALEQAVAVGEHAVVRVLEALEGEGVRMSWLGLTGSRALGIAHQHSDVDIVVYENHVLVHDIFRRLAGAPAGARLGGVRVEPNVDASWRKAILAGHPATWTPANNLCPPLRRYYAIDPPLAPATRNADVPPAQETALGYPPCARTRDGIWIVSFEYNLAGLLYEGGIFRISGTVSTSGRIIYLGLRERPGALTLQASPDGGRSN